MAQNEDAALKPESKAQFIHPSCTSHGELQPPPNFDLSNTYRFPGHNSVSAAAEVALRIRATAENLNQRNLSTSSPSDVNRTPPTSSLQAAIALIASTTFSTFAGSATERTELYSAPTSENQPIELVLRAAAAASEGYESVDGGGSCAGGGGNKNSVFPTTTLPSVGLPSFASRYTSNFSSDMPLSACFTNSLLSANLIPRVGHTPSANTYQQSSSPAYLPAISNALSTGFQLVGTESAGSFNTTTSTTSPTNTDTGHFSSASLTSSTTHHEDGSRKREQRLLKNREAARECRRKKKEYVRCLERRVAILEGQNEQLISELQKLKSICGNAGLLIVANNVSSHPPVENTFDRHRVEGMDFVDHCSSNMKPELDESHKEPIVLHLRGVSDFATSPLRDISPSDQRQFTSLDQEETFPTDTLSINLPNQRNQLGSRNTSSDCPQVDIVSSKLSYFPSMGEGHLSTKKSVCRRTDEFENQQQQKMDSSLCVLNPESAAASEKTFATVDEKPLFSYALPPADKPCALGDHGEKPPDWYDRDPSSSFSPILISPYYPPLKRELRKLDQERNRLLKHQAVITAEASGTQEKPSAVNSDQ